MKPVLKKVKFFLGYFLFVFSMLLVFAGGAAGQGKKVFVGTGSGFIDYPNAQATLNLNDDDTVVIKPGVYKLMNFGNITASPGHKIIITNSGQVEFTDPSPSTFSNLTNVEIRGDGTAGIDFGFYMHDVLKGILMQGTFSHVYFSYIKMVNVTDYGIFMSNPALVYDGTNNKNSLFYDIKFLHFSVANIMTTFLQVGLYTRIIDDGLVNMTRNLEFAYSTIDYSDQFDVLHLDKAVNVNIHHNRFSHLGKSDFRHSAIVYLYGNGDIHHNYIGDYWGSGVRAHAFSLDSIGTVNVYNNIMVNSRKYSGVEAQSTAEDMAYSPYVHYCNFKIYNNTFGNLSAYDWAAAMVDTYDASGGTIEIKNNLGFNIERDLPYDATKNYIYDQLNITKPDTAGNLYRRNYTDIGLINDSSCFLNVNSPAIDRGITIASIKDDIDGVTRPQSGAYDIGAREYLTGIVFPIANAGADTSTVLPKDSVRLNGSASFNPTGGTLTFKWTQVSGPAAAVFAADTSATPLVKNLVQGTYQLKLTVTNAQGHSNEDLMVLVVSPVPVFPPVANAGGTTTITLPVNSTPLNGAASSNSAGGALKYAWTKIAGPAAFSISGDTTATPFISSLVAGSYQVRLTVTNSNGLTATDVATVVVNPAPVPTASAGADVFLVLPVNTVTLDGSASTTPGGGTLSYAWAKVSGPAAFVITGETTARPAISGLAEGVYQLKLTVTNSAGITASDFVNITVSAAPVAVANAGADINIVLPVSTATLNGSASYSTGGGALTYDWSMVSGPAAYTINGAGTATPSITGLQQGIYTIRLKVTNAEGSTAEDLVAVTVTAIPVYPPVCKAGADINITLPVNSAILNGDQSYSLDGGTLTYAWSLISGPPSFVITNAVSATPTVSNLTEGAYQVKLVVTNQQGISSEDEVTINVSPLPPSPPVANAGADITITLPVNAVNLNGSASANATGGALTYSWVLVSGPSSFSITGQNTATPSLSNLAQGTYQVKLVVTNAQGLSAEDIVTVTVLALQNPVAAAGTDIGIVLPVNTATLNGSGSYDPAGGALIYSWTKITGPLSFVITGANTAAPVISNLAAGVYQLRLTVTNAGGLSASDMVVVSVNMPLLAVPRTGGDTTINFPGGYALLNGGIAGGSGADTVVTYHWQQLSGPTTAVIANSEQMKTKATNLEPGVYSFQLRITDNYGQTNTASFKVTVVNSMTGRKSLLLYPNPCATFIHVRAITDSTGDVLLRVTNLSGIVMQQQLFRKNQLLFDETMNTSQLPAGAYVLEVVIAGRVQLLGKFVKR